MSKMRTLSAALLASATVAGSMISCRDRPTEPAVATRQAPDATLQRHPAKQRAALLTDVPVSGTVEQGGTFVGHLTAKKITIDPTTGILTMEMVLNGTATTATGTVEIVDQAVSAPMTLHRQGEEAKAIVRPAQLATCGILFLDLGPLHLDLLGLTIDLAEVILDVNAVTGPGNLLGNLLCALLGLLDLPGVLASISHILDNINTILSGLTVPGIGGAAWMVPGVPATTTFFST